MSDIFEVEPRGSNEDCVKTLVGLLGGPAGMMAQGVRLEDLARVLEADPTDDLQGLRMLAGRSSALSWSSVSPNSHDEEPLMSPRVAEWWLESTGRMVCGPEGLEFPEGSKPDHLTLAAYDIVQSGVSSHLSAVYARITTSTTTLAPSMIADVSLAAHKSHYRHFHPDASKLE